MNREEFFAKLAPLDDGRLRKVLWNLYWRGPAAIRERVEGELDPVEHARRKQAAAAPPGPGLVLDEVREFAELARAGAYLAGDRRASPKERTRWRVTFRRLAAGAQAALRAPDPAPAEEALALIIDLACEMKGSQYFRSEDPVEAARFVVSDAAALLWETVRDRHGFSAFTRQSAPQLLRWESRYGWTTHGWGQVCEKETSLASVLAGMLAAPGRVDHLRRLLPGRPRPGGPGRRDRPAADLLRLLGTGRQRLPATGTGQEPRGMAWPAAGAAGRLGGRGPPRRLASHRALDGPDRTFLQARLAHQRGDTAAARKLIAGCLRELPGDQDFARFAARIGAG